MSVADRDDPSTRVGQPELDAAIAAVDVSGPIATAIGVHAAAADPHPGYDTDAKVTTAIGVHAGASNPHPSYLKDHGAVTYLDATDATAPGNPSSGAHRIYSKSDGIYYRDSAGVEKGPLGAGGTPGGSFPPLYDHAAARQCYATGSPNASDRLTDTFFGAGVAVPQTIEFDLGEFATPAVGSVRVLWRDSAHRSDTGQLQYSTDHTTWVAAETWTGDTTLDRWYVFAPITARWWRLYTTVTGSPGSTGADCNVFALFASGRNVAVGALTSGTNMTATASGVDGLTSTSANGTAGVGGGVVNALHVDLGSAMAITGAHVRYADGGHIATAGLLEYSTDDAAWTTADAFSNGNIDHYMPFTNPITARYWRITATAVVVNNGMNIAEFELASAA